MRTSTRVVSTVALASMLLTGATAPAQEQAAAPQPGHKVAEAIGIGIVVGVVVATVILIDIHRNHRTIKGCITSGPEGMQLANDKDGKTYTLIGRTAKTQAGEVVEVKGKREKGDEKGEWNFLVKKVKKDYGPCPAGPAAAPATLAATVVDANSHRPIAGATVTVGDGSGTTDARGNAMVNNLAAGEQTPATASAPGYDQKTVSVHLTPGGSGQVRFELQRHRDGGDIERNIGATGTASLRGVNFDTNSSTLRPDSLVTLQQALAVINKRPNSHWIIAGHTDSQGSADVNQRLSDARAGAVMDWLIEHGIDESRLTAKGYGSTKPVADNSTEEGRAQNRRVELVLVK